MFFRRDGFDASLSSSPGRRWRFRELGRPGSQWWGLSLSPSADFYPNFKYNRTNGKIRKGLGCI